MDLQEMSAQFTNLDDLNVRINAEVEAKYAEIELLHGPKVRKFVEVNARVLSVAGCIVTGIQVISGSHNSLEGGVLTELLTEVCANCSSLATDLYLPGASIDTMIAHLELAKDIVDFRNAAIARFMG